MLCFMNYGGYHLPSNTAKNLVIKIRITKYIVVSDGN